jgi:predicted flap endonuclease-1-like 5' DNA nuclease
MSTENDTGMLNTCNAVCWILAFAAGLFIASVCVYWAGLHGLVSTVIGLVVLLGAGYLFPQVFCTGRDAVPAEPVAPTPAATSAAPVVPEAVAEPEPAAVSEDSARKPKLYGAAPDSIDDLKVISGVGPALEKKLNDLGVYRYDQIASWKKADIEWVDGQLKFRGRIERDDWVKQAKKLAKG